ncbi:hypothetical protein B0H13DRAFT_1851977 [Mycena leptocephala]|nr:hypothetical protein B0H13DRAFT_1851977 [Mycena leptocephala]
MTDHPGMLFGHVDLPTIFLPLSPWSNSLQAERDAGAKDNTASLAREKIFQSDIKLLQEKMKIDRHRSDLQKQVNTFRREIDEEKAGRREWVLRRAEINSQLEQLRKSPLAGVRINGRRPTDCPLEATSDIGIFNSAIPSAAHYFPDPAEPVAHIEHGQFSVATDNQSDNGVSLDTNLHIGLDTDRVSNFTLPGIPVDVTEYGTELEASWQTLGTVAPGCPITGGRIAARTQDSPLRRRHPGHATGSSASAGAAQTSRRRPERVARAKDASVSTTALTRTNRSWTSRVTSTHFLPLPCTYNESMGELSWQQPLRALLIAASKFFLRLGHRPVDAKKHLYAKGYSHDSGASIESLDDLAKVLLQIAADTSSVVIADACRAVATLLELWKRDDVLEGIASDVKRLVERAETTHPGRLESDNTDDSVVTDLRSAAEILTQTVEEQCKDIWKLTERLEEGFTQIVQRVTDAISTSPLASGTGPTPDAVNIPTTRSYAAAVAQYRARYPGGSGPSIYSSVGAEVVE